MNLSDEERQRLREGMPKIEQGIVRNIIKAVTEGRIPTDRQLEMLKSAVAMPDSTPSATAAPEFQLDTSVPDDRKGIAEFYRVVPLTITRWKNAGREAKDPCPVKTPAQMPDWYKRVFPDKPIPEGIEAAAARMAPPATAAPAALAGESRLPALDMSQFNPAEYNFDTMLMSMATLMLAQRQLLEDALKSGDRRLISEATEKFQETVEAMRRLEKDSGKIQESQGLTLRTADVRAVIVETHQFIPAKYKATLKAAMRYLPGLTMTEQEMDEWADKHVDEACAGLKKDLLASISKAA